MKNEKTASSEPTSLPTLLSVVSDELNFLASDVERLHDIVDLPGVRDLLRQAQCFNVLQGIDHITQNLAGLAEFLKTVAASAPHTQLDTRAACDAVLLASLSDRLKQPSQPRKVHTGGDECEFF